MCAHAHTVEVVATCARGSLPWMTSVRAGHSTRTCASRARVHGLPPMLPRCNRATSFGASTWLVQCLQPDSAVFIVSWTAVHVVRFAQSLSVGWRGVVVLVYAVVMHVFAKCL